MIMKWAVGFTAVISIILAVFVVLRSPVDSKFESNSDVIWKDSQVVMKIVEFKDGNKTRKCLVTVGTQSVSVVLLETN